MTREEFTTLPIRINLHGNPPLEQHGEFIDLAVDRDYALDKGQLAILSLGVSMELPEGYYAEVLPRSSTPKKHGILCANSEGIIENDYHGDGDVWGFPAYAIRDTFIPKGTRIAQFRLVAKAPKVSFIEVESLGNANRGGFGSTGEGNTDHKAKEGR